MDRKYDKKRSTQRASGNRHNAGWQSSIEQPTGRGYSSKQRKPRYSSSYGSGNGKPDQKPLTSTYTRSSGKKSVFNGERRRRQKRHRRLIVASFLIIVLAVGGYFAVKAFSSTKNVSSSGGDSVSIAQGISSSAASTSTTTTQTASEQTGAASTEPAAITVAAVGDMIFDRNVETLIESSGGEAPLTYVADILSEADITVGNLESPLSNNGTANPDKDVTLCGDPDGVEGLVAAGFDLVSLANNHMLDYGDEALQDTLDILDENGIGHAGAGLTKAEAWTASVIERNGSTVAFLSFSNILPSGFVATDTSAGIAAGRTDMDAVCAAIADAKENYDYVIVAFHWGVEYEDYANSDQVEAAHQAVDAGADMIVAHHPHVIEGVEFYNGAFIAYSLGDFVFDHYSRKTGEAFILNATLTADGITEVTATPVYLDESGAPEVVTGDEAETILERLSTISGDYDTNVEIDGDIARITASA